MPKLRPRVFDESWKKVLEKYFWHFLAFYFPQVASELDQSKGYTFLEQELQKIMRKAKSKKRRLERV